MCDSSVFILNMN